VLDLPPAVGAGDDWWARASEAIARAEYEVSPSEDGFRAPNRAQNLRTWYRYDGAEVKSAVLKPGGEWIWKWRTLAFGRPGDMKPSPATVPRAKGTRVEYHRAGLVEWYENTRAGVEQGFTFMSRPAGVGRLRVEGAFSRELRALVSPQGDAISFVDRSGTPVLSYGSLAALDARGTKLPARFEVAECALAIVVDDRGATYPLTIDPLMTTSAWTAESNQVDAAFGYSVASAGDVNGDGFADVIVGAPHFDNGQGDEGRAFLYLGSSRGLSPTYDWTAECDQDSAGFGDSVASAGDVNRDGYADVIVGASLYDGTAKNEGRACVYLGSASGLAASPAWTATGGQQDAFFGCSVATAGDVNGDGYSDVVVGAYAYDGTRTDEGRAFVYRGSASGPDASPSWTVSGGQEAGEFGWSVSTAGDVNRDGFSDVIVGARWYDNGQNYEGRAFVFHGSKFGLITAPAWTAESDQVDGLFGSSVCSAGDVNGDGYGDVIVGAPLYSNGQREEGRAYAYLGSTLGLSAQPAWVAESNQVGAKFGGSVAGAGDVNGDGFDDVLVGASEYDAGQADVGQATLYYGSGTGSLWAAPVWTVVGDRPGARLGCAVSRAGDVNGDGYSDVIVGAYACDNGQAGEGLAFAYHGGATGLNGAEAWTAEANQAHAHFGFSVASAGDVNADGFGDLLAGAPFHQNGQGYEGQATLFPGFIGGLHAATWTAESDQDTALFAYSVASAGDVNGDGYGDVIVGAYLFDETEIDEGRAYLYLGCATGLAATPAWTAHGGQEDARFGYSVAGAGDVNGDGYADVIIGAHRYDHGSVDEGEALVYYGSPSGLGASPGWTAEGNQGGADFGSSVAGAGDVNHDGFDDVIIGARTYDHGENNEGCAFVYLGSASGLAATPVWMGESNQAEARFGFSVASAGDVNGDAFDDVIIGAYVYENGESQEGAAYVYLGSATGPRAIPAWTAESDQVDAFFGCSVAGVGDVNGDGYDDVLVGAYAWDGDETDEGAAFLYKGSHYGLSHNPAWTAEGDQAYAWFGYAVGPAGDINRDGFADVVVGAHKYNNPSDNEGRAYVYYDFRGSGATAAVLEFAQPKGGLRFESIFPNPARSNSVLSYVLPRSGAVRLSIHDLLGRRVAVLADGVEEAGAHSAIWEGRDARGAAVPAGVYWARLESSGATAAQKIVRSR
jgi:FG-GAP repeat protein/VCBS repeat protein